MGTGECLSHHSWESSKNAQTWHSGGCGLVVGRGSAGLVAGLDESRGLFQPKPFHDSAISESPEERRSADRRQHKSDFRFCDTLCFPYNNLHPVPTFSNNSSWCSSQAWAHNKLPWHGMSVFTLGAGVPGAAASALPRHRSEHRPSHTAQQANISLKTLPWSQNCCREQDSSDPNTLEI